MKAFYITEPGNSALRDLPEPSPQPGEVLLKTRIIGLCGTDLSTFRGKNPLVSYPRIPGHEIAATIVAVGEGVPARIQTGTRRYRLSKHQLRPLRFLFAGPDECLQVQRDFRRAARRSDEELFHHRAGRNS